MYSESLDGMSLIDLDYFYRMYQERYDHLLTELSNGAFRQFDEVETMIAEKKKLEEEMKIVKAIKDKKFDLMRKLYFGTNTHTK